MEPGVFFSSVAGWGGVHQTPHGGLPRACWVPATGGVLTIFLAFFWRDFFVPKIDTQELIPQPRSTPPRRPSEQAASGVVSRPREGGATPAGGVNFLVFFVIVVRNSPLVSFWVQAPIQQGEGVGSTPCGRGTPPRLEANPWMERCQDQLVFTGPKASHQSSVAFPAEPHPRLYHSCPEGWHLRQMGFTGGGRSQEPVAQSSEQKWF